MLRQLEPAMDPSACNPQTWPQFECGPLFRMTLLGELASVQNRVWSRCSLHDAQEGPGVQSGAPELARGEMTQPSHNE